MIRLGPTRHKRDVEQALPAALVRDGDTVGRDARLTTMVRRDFDLIWQLLRRLGLPPADADDAVQSVFLTASQRLDSIREGSERAFLYGVARRIAANHRRKCGRRGPELCADPDEAPSEDLQPDDELEARRTRRLVDSVLAAMPIELRVVFVLSQIQELSLSEIAALQGIPQGTVASRLRRAKLSFGEHLARLSQVPRGGGGS